jgi:transcription initiation factor TFIID subunit 6
MLLFISAILHNPNFFVEPYLHQFMPPILSCLVAKRICENSLEDHWSFRRAAADLVAYVCTNFGEVYQSLNPRVSRTLLRAFLDPSKSLTTHFGAIVGITKLGPDFIKALLIPNIKVYVDILRPKLEEDNELKRIEAQHCLEALAV